MNLGEMNIRTMRLEDLRMAGYNPRKISGEAYGGLGASIDRFGLLLPIVWNERSGNIVGGHQRYRQLIEKGEESTEVVVVDFDETEEIALNIALNSGTLRGDFSEDASAMLERASKVTGESFADLRLPNLVARLKKASSGDGNGGSGGGDGGGGGGGGDNDPPGPSAVVTCPKCKSRWKMKNNEVIENAFEGWSGNTEDEPGESEAEAGESEDDFTSEFFEVNAVD